MWCRREKLVIKPYFPAAHNKVIHTGIFLMWDWAGMSTAEQTSSVAVQK